MYLSSHFPFAKLKLGDACTSPQPMFLEIFDYYETYACKQFLERRHHDGIALLGCTKCSELESTKLF